MYGKLVISWLGYYIPLLSTVGQVAKTLPFHGSNMGSIPIRCIVENSITFSQEGGVGSIPS